MLTYHDLIHVMEFLQAQGASQDTLDRVLMAIWEETESHPVHRQSAQRPALLA